MSTLNRSQANKLNRTASNLIDFGPAIRNALVKNGVSEKAWYQVLGAIEFLIEESDTSSGLT